MCKNMIKQMLKITNVLLLALAFLFSNLNADNYPKKPINLVVGFGIGGSADRMTRAMATFLSDELDARIKVINKKGASTQIAANYVLKKPADGYTVFTSTFAPFLANTILSSNAKYKIGDFDFINIQWFDFELFALNKNSKYNNMMEVLEAIKKHPKKIKAAIFQGSAGHIILKLLLEKFGIPQENINLVIYNGGGKARTAVAGGQVDLIAISAQGCESIREFIKPIAVLRDKRSKKWDAPTLNEAISSSGIKMPVLKGSMRGFAVSKKMKEKYPKRYKKLVDGFKKTLAKKSVQKFLKKNDIGYTWTGPEKSNKLILESYDVFKKYSHLLKK